MLLCVPLDARQTSRNGIYFLVRDLKLDLFRAVFPICGRARGCMSWSTDMHALVCGAGHPGYFLSRKKWTKVCLRLPVEYLWWLVVMLCIVVSCVFGLRSLLDCTHRASRQVKKVLKILLRGTQCQSCIYILFLRKNINWSLLRIKSITAPWHTGYVLIFPNTTINFCFELLV